MPHVIVSNATTPAAFRDQMIAEIDRQIASSRVNAVRARTKRDSIKIGETILTLEGVKWFLENVQFNGGFNEAELDLI